MIREPLKNLYNKETVTKLSKNIKESYTPFEEENFINSVLDHTWESLELKERTNHIAINLRKFLPQNYKEAISIIDKIIVNEPDWKESLCWYFPTFVEMYGLDMENWEISIFAMARYTRFASAEFAVRPFIIKYQEKMMAQMYEWSKSDDEHIRRLACEGCRPALPWGQVLSAFKKDPTPILPILQQLKADQDMYVKKSVANNLNDISKTHPDLVTKIVKDWYGENPHTDWIVKHACRTLLKKGNPEVLSIFGFNDANGIEVSNFTVDKTSVPMGDSVNFSFRITTKEDTKVRLEYGMDFVKANGKHSRKIFQISEISLKAGQNKEYIKKHSFADLSTRKHYKGVHCALLIVNGRERGALEIELV